MADGFCEHFYTNPVGLEQLILQADLRVHLFGEGFINYPATLEDIRKSCEDLNWSRPVMTAMIDGKPRHRCFFHSLPDSYIKWLVLTADDIPVLLQRVEMAASAFHTLDITWPGSLIRFKTEDEQ